MDALFGPVDADLPVAVDKDAERIRQLVAREGESFTGREVRGLNDAILKLVSRPAASVIGSLEASEYLERCIAAAESVLIDRHRGYSRLRWLWYLRRAPDELFAGRHPSTLGYDRALAECLTALVDSTDERVESERPLRYPIDEGVCRHILRLVAGTKFLAQLHVLARYAGKRATFRTRHPLAPLEVVADSVPAQAIRLYDERLGGEDAHVSAGLGLTSASASSLHGTRSDLLLLTRCKPYALRCSVSDEVSARDVVVSARSAFQWLPAKQLLLPFGEVLGPESYPSPQALALVMFQIACPLFVTRAPWSPPSLTQFGYVLVREELALEILADALPPVSDELRALGYEAGLPDDEHQWLATLEGTAPRLWPMTRGGFVRRLKTMIAFDMASSSQAVLDLLRSKRLSGESGNQRGRQFEVNLQARINETAWKPPEDILELRGRTLTIGGDKVTDPDAIATSGRTLLLVSCKSVIYDSDYDAGRFSVINKARDVVSKALAEWEGKIATLSATLVGDNYNFSAYDDFIGVVCTPFAPYTDDPAALRFVRPGLRANSSASELVDWLKKQGT